LNSFDGEVKLTAYSRFNLYKLFLHDALMATVGHTVSLGIEPQAGVEVAEVLNELEVNRKGRYQLTNLEVQDLRNIYRLAPEPPNFGGEKSNSPQSKGASWWNA
jgi:hypothetical protein